MNATVSIKGVGDGLTIAPGDGPWDVLMDDLAHQLATREKFFQGGRAAVNTGERELGPAELEKISDLLASHGIVLWAVLSEHASTQEAARKLELGTRLPGSGVELAGSDRRLEPLHSAPCKQSEAENGSHCMLVRGAPQRPASRARPKTAAIACWYVARCAPAGWSRVQVTLSSSVT
jgi:hypothetical protein